MALFLLPAFALSQTTFQCPDSKDADPTCVVATATLNADATDGRLSFDSQLSAESGHTDWVPLGMFATNNVLQVDVSMGGCGAHHGFQMTLTSGWQGPDGSVTLEDRVYAKLFHAPMSANAADARDVQLVYKNIPNDAGKSSNFVYLYLIYPDEYGYTENVCEGTANKMTFTVNSNFKDGYEMEYDRAIETSAANYMPVRTVDITTLNEMAPVITKHQLLARSDEDDGDNIDHIPIGRVAVNDVLHLDVTVGGCGATHGYRISLYAEWLSNNAETVDNKVYAYVQHQNKHVTSDALEIRYMGIPQESDVEGGKQSGDMYVYMFFKDDYGWHEAQCAGQTNTVQVKSSHSALQNNHKFLPGAKDISFHNNELAGKYKAATVIDLATVGNMYTKDAVDQAIKDALADIVDSACFIHPIDGGRSRRDEGHRCARETHLEKSKHKEVAIVLVLLVLMVGIVGGVWFYMNKGSRQNESGNYSKLSIQADGGQDDAIADGDNPFDGSTATSEPIEPDEEPDAFGAAVGGF